MNLLGQYLMLIRWYLIAHSMRVLECISTRINKVTDKLLASLVIDWVYLVWLYRR